MSLTITVVYWLVLYNGKNTALEFYLTFNDHAVQSLISLTDIIISERTWRITHFYCVLIYGMTYEIFQVLYLVAAGGLDEIGNSYIYYIVNWNSNPGEALGITCGMMAAGLFCYSIICLLAHGMEKITKRTGRNHQRLLM